MSGQQLPRRVRRIIDSMVQITIGSIIGNHNTPYAQIAEQPEKELLLVGLSRPLFLFKTTMDNCLALACALLPATAKS